MDSEGMEFVPHFSLQCLIDHLVLFDAADPAKAFGDDMGGVMFAVPAQIFDTDIRIRPHLLIWLSYFWISNSST